MQQIFVLTLRALGRGRRLLAVGVLLAVPALLSIAYSASGGAGRGDGGRFAIELFGQLVLPILLPLTALIFATSALGGEVEDRTLIYLTLRPVSRLVIVVAKLCAVALLTLGFVEVSLAVTYLIAARGAGDGHALGAILLGGACGALAYASLFLLVGLLAPRRALIVGFLYVLVWEGAGHALGAPLRAGRATRRARLLAAGVRAAVERHRRGQPRRADARRARRHRPHRSASAPPGTALAFSHRPTRPTTTRPRRWPPTSP